MDVKRYRDFIKFKGSIIAYSLVEDTFDDEAVTIEIVLDAPVCLLYTSDAADE